MKKRSPEVFDTIFRQAYKEGMLPIFDMRARAWFRRKAQETKAITAPKVIRERNLITKMPRIGDCLIFEYQAKWAERLPYWDRYPAIFLIGIYPQENKFLGINLHYLPYNLRAKLMDALYSNLFPTEDGYNMKVTYRILKSASRYRAFWPCIKQYHIGNIKSRMVQVTPNEYDIALFLPIARFQKKTQEYVWKESEGIIGKYKPGPGRWLKLTRKFLSHHGIKLINTISKVL